MIPEPADVYLGLRAQALGVGRENLAPGGGGSSLIGLLMETGYPSAVVTLVGLADGATSLYFSTGGGVIGGGEHADVATATIRWLEVGEQLLTRLDETEDAPLPAEGTTQFVAITDKGHAAISASNAELGAGGNPLSPLFYAGQGVITALRLLDEQPKKNL